MSTSNNVLRNHMSYIMSDVATSATLKKKKNDFLEIVCFLESVCISILYVCGIF